VHDPGGRGIDTRCQLDTRPVRGVAWTSGAGSSREQMVVDWRMAVDWEYERTHHPESCQIGAGLRPTSRAGPTEKPKGQGLGVECPARRAVRVLVVQDHRLLGEGLRALLESEPDLEATLARTAEEALAAAAADPAVAVIDHRLLDPSDELVGILRREGVPMLLLGVDEGTSTLAAVEVGAHGLLGPTCSRSDLVRAVRLLAAGETVLPPTTVKRALEEQRHRAAVEVQRRLAERLTARERQVLGLVAAGLGNRAVATRLGIRYSTVRSHVRALIGKLGAHSRLQAVARARELGLLRRQDVHWNSRSSRKGLSG
jgi:DNA-binding NarL/FixJ family response regulator